MNEYEHNLIGYLAADGTFYECDSYGHMLKAVELCKTLYNEEFMSPVKAENFLLDKGFVIFYDSAIGFYEVGGNDSNKRLSNIQKYFLMDEERLCTNNDKVNSIKMVLLRNSKLS